MCAARKRLLGTIDQSGWPINLNLVGVLIALVRLHGENRIISAVLTISPDDVLINVDNCLHRVPEWNRTTAHGLRSAALYR